MRANRILQSLSPGFKEGWEGLSELDVAALIKQEALAIGIKVKLFGEGKVFALEMPLQKALQGVLENFKQHGQPEDVQVTIEQDNGKLKILFTAPEMTGQVSAEKVARMFEPFWTTSQSGNGAWAVFGLRAYQTGVQWAAGSGAGFAATVGV